MARENDKKWISGIAIVVLLIISVWVLSGIIIFNRLPTWQERGTFGDMFGAINSLFSGLALAGVIYAILLQQQELQYQREELEATRKELSRAAEAQEKSEKALRRQSQAHFLAAKLTALSSILSHYDSQAVSGKGLIKHYSSQDADKVMEAIKILIEEQFEDEIK